MYSSEAMAVLQPDNCTDNGAGQGCGTPAGHGGIAPRWAPPEPVFCSSNDTPNDLDGGDMSAGSHRIAAHKLQTLIFQSAGYSIVGDFFRGWPVLSGELDPLQQNPYWR
jgi:hypothetical protein